jgi:hypothetical protein
MRAEREEANKVADIYQSYLPREIRRPDAASASSRRSSVIADINIPQRIL